MRLLLLAGAINLAFTSASMMAAEGPGIQLWAVDPLVKVFPDSAPTPGEAPAEDTPLCKSWPAARHKSRS
jgi:hypothetical protein